MYDAECFKKTVVGVMNNLITLFPYVEMDFMMAENPGVTQEEATAPLAKLGTAVRELGDICKTYVKKGGIDGVAVAIGKHLAEPVDTAYNSYRQGHAYLTQKTRERLMKAFATMKGYIDELSEGKIPDRINEEMSTSEMVLEQLRTR